MSTPLSQHPYWYYRQTNDSPLVTPAYLARERAIQLRGQYAQEHENTVMDAADSFTSIADVDFAMGTGWTEQVWGQPGRVYKYGVDLGYVHDPTVITIGHGDASAVYIDKIITLQGSREHPVLMPVVQQTILDLVPRFPPATPHGIRIESWQGLQASQELTGRDLPVQLFAATAKAHAEEWPVLAQRLSSRTLVLFPHARLREELLNLTYEVGPSGVRVTDKGKVHQDHAVALRLVVAGLTGPILPPFAFFSGGRLLSSVADAVSSVVHSLCAGLTATGQALAAPVHTLVDAEPQCVPHPGGRKRTIQELENLDPGCRSPQEQARLDKFYARPHIDTPYEAHVRQEGVVFPEDGPPPADDWRTAIALKFLHMR